MKEQKTILLDEDEALTAMVEYRQLRDKGYNVIHVFNGELALNCLFHDKTPIDLILMDIDLGGGMATDITDKKFAEANNRAI